MSRGCSLTGWVDPWIIRTLLIDNTATEQIVTREQRERVSHPDWSGDA